MYILAPLTSHVEDIRHIHGFELNVTLGIENVISRACIVAAFVDVHIHARWNGSSSNQSDLHLSFSSFIYTAHGYEHQQGVNCYLTCNRWNMKILASRWCHLCMYSTSCCVQLYKCVQGRNNWISIVETNRSLRYVRSWWLLCRNLGYACDFISQVAPQNTLLQKKSCRTPQSEMMITLDWTLDLTTNDFSGTLVHPHCMRW